MKKKGSNLLRNVGHGANDLYWFILPSLLPVILEQYELKYIGAGGILAAYLGAIAVFSFVLGKTSDSVSRQRLMGFGFIIASGFFILSTAVDNIAVFVSCVLVAGIGVSSFHPAIYASIDEHTTRDHGMVYGMFEFWGSVAVFGMFVLHGFLFREIGWKPILILTSIPGLVVGSLYIRYGALFNSSDPEQTSEQKPSGEFSMIHFVLFLLVISFRFLGLIAVINFTPTYLVREIGVSKSIASWATGVYFLGGLVFTPIAGKLCDRWGPFQVLLITTGLVTPFIFLVGTSSPLWALILYLLPIGACYYGVGPATDILIARLGSGMGKGEAFGYMVAVISVAFSLSPLIFGAVADRIGLTATIRLFSLPLLASFIVLLFLWIIQRPAGGRNAA
ncbi:MAG: MFS transporter [Spirochaetes bacterium]|nr:MFS transporter [Spirochaetota bacterium]